ncbi:PASTA domain-containing protein [Dactylosporangium cerinum]|uniref:PASTA domain-containing protein n=1 Tax=Dactylosporangium cerinum TaxID=1434730 RepID=A0ABV9WDV9_9ACTN
MRTPLRAGLFALVVAAAALVTAPAAHAGSTDPAPPGLYVLVPDVVGEPLADAKSDLVKSGLRAGAGSIGVEDCVNLGRVIKQNPAAKTLVLRGSGVDLVVGIEPPKGCEVIQ